MKKNSIWVSDMYGLMNWALLKSKLIRLRLKPFRMTAQVARGALIVLEGGDKSGKSTQCRKLVENLMTKGIQAELWRYPERSTAIGKVISDYLEKKIELEDHAIHLLFSANRWESVPKMKTLLAKGVTLVIDRYAFSGAAFTGAKAGFCLDWCRSADVGLPAPDAVFYLTLNPDVAATRGDFGGERYEDTDFQKIVETNFSSHNGGFCTTCSMHWVCRPLAIFLLIILKSNHLADYVTILGVLLMHRAQLKSSNLICCNRPSASSKQANSNLWAIYGLSGKLEKTLGEMTQKFSRRTTVLIADLQSLYPLIGPFPRDMLFLWSPRYCYDQCWVWLASSEVFNCAESTLLVMHNWALFVSVELLHWSYL